MNLKFKVGDFITIDFPFDQNDEQKRRPAFVLDINENLHMVLLAYCSTKKLSSNPLPREVVLSENEISLVGLKRPTRIDFGYRKSFSIMDAEQCESIGSMSSLGNQFIRKMAAACNAAGCN